MPPTLKGFAMCGLCANIIQPHIAKPMLYEEVFFNSAMRGKAEQ